MSGSFGFGPNNGGDDENPRDNSGVPNMGDFFAQFANMGINPQSLFTGFNNAAQNAANNGALVPVAVIRDVARKFLATQSEIPVGLGDLAQTEEALNIANTWLNRDQQVPLYCFPPYLNLTNANYKDIISLGIKELEPNNPIRPSIDEILLKKLIKLYPCGYN